MNWTLPLITVAALTWPLFRTLGGPDRAHMWARSRRIRVLSIAAMVLCSAVGVAAFLGPPTVQWALVVASLVCLVVFLVYTSPYFGRRRGLRDHDVARSTRPRLRPRSLAARHRRAPCSRRLGPAVPAGPALGGDRRCREGRGIGAATASVMLIL